MYSAYTSDEPFFIILQLFIFFHLSQMILEVELTRNIDIKMMALRGGGGGILFCENHR